MDLNLAYAVVEFELAKYSMEKVGRVKGCQIISI